MEANNELARWLPLSLDDIGPVVDLWGVMAALAFGSLFHGSPVRYGAA